MGFASLKGMLKDTDKQDIVILARDSEKNRTILAPYGKTPGLEIVWGRPDGLPGGFTVREGL